jgi:hypothetical protein
VSAAVSQAGRELDSASTLKLAAQQLEKAVYWRDLSFGDWWACERRALRQMMRKCALESRASFFGSRGGAS